MEDIMIAPVEQETEQVKESLISPYAVPGVIIFGPQELIESIVSILYNFKDDEMKQKTRKGEVVEARQICMALYYHLFRNKGATLAEAGAPFEKDHATVLHAMKTIRNRLSTQPKDRLAVNYREAFLKFAEYGTIKNQTTRYELL